MKRNRLKNLLLKELSLVDHPANQHARVSLFKRLFGKSDAPQPDLTEVLAESVDSILKDLSLSPDQRDELLEKSFAEYKDAVVLKATGADDGDGPDDEGPDDTDDDTPVTKTGQPDAGASSGEPNRTEPVMKNGEDVLKGLTPEQRAHVESFQKSANEAIAKANEATEKANAAIAKTQEAERLTVAKGLVGDTGAATPEQVASVLKQLDTEGVKVVEGILTKVGTLAKSAKLFEELGAGGVGSDAPASEQEITKRAEELRKSNPKLSKAQSIAKALQENPDLYEQSLAGE